MDILTIDKNKIDELIAAKNFIGLNHSPRPEKIIVSLTSYKPRIHDVKYAIYSLLNQTFPPDKLILWLDEDSFPQREKNLPYDLLELKNFGLTIDWCENLRPYKKFIPALEKYPDDIIVTADDDLMYLPDWLEILYEEHLKNPGCVVAHYAHKVRLNERGKFFPFKKWGLNIKPAISLPPAFTYAPGTGGGMLFKKKFLHDDILKREIFLELAPIGDEIWIWAMSVLNGTKIKIPTAAQNQLIFVDLHREKYGETLRKENVERGKQDIQLRRITEKYPDVLDALIREDVETLPYLSIIMILENIENINDYVKNIFEQKFPDFERIVINLGSRVEVPMLPTNFKVINYPGGTELDALNLGLRNAAGKYVLFKDANSTLTDNALDIIAQMADNSAADVIHFAGHLQLDGQIIFDDELLFDGDRPIFFDEPKQNRAVMWLQDKLSGRLDTKIFRREFLMRHKINLGGGLAEFLFEALIHAEKYLIVPQAFCVCKD